MHACLIFSIGQACDRQDELRSLVDYNSGMLLESVGTGIDRETAATGNTEVVCAKMKTIESLGLSDLIEDILISLMRAAHLAGPVGAYRSPD